MDKHEHVLDKEKTRVSQDDVAGELTANDLNKTTDNKVNQQKHKQSPAMASEVTAGGADKPGLLEK